ncbi:hypothetical protein [Alienimonas californiensis]|uniref:Uncharacterized protein n=1 Tax=Alienimonas californiensis TaxID=2527989 RepID=A0A517P8S0_9PLAN|nr:hypothetical protein [Alienimonas californiensis]QDT15770.1 hypothetical protein CA12_18640 [Alienimonas californiensis]
MIDLVHGPAVQLLLHNIAPAFLYAAIWSMCCAMAVRRCGIGTPGARPLAAGTGLLAVTHVLRTVWPWIVILCQPDERAEVFQQPWYHLVQLASYLTAFLAPPLIAWGLWLTWRGYDRAGAEATP